MAYYVKTTGTCGNEETTGDFADLSAARYEARTQRRNKDLTRVDVCQRGTGRILAAWDRLDSNFRWVKTL